MSSMGVEILLVETATRISSSELRVSPDIGYGNNDAFIRLFILSYAKFLYDSPLELGYKPDHVVKHFLGRLCSTHVRDTIKQYSSWADELLSNEYATGSDSSTRIFHPFFKELPIFRECLEWVKTGRPDLLTYILSFLTFGKKLEYVDEEFNTTAFRGWLEVEERLRTLEFQENDTSSLKNIIELILAPLDDTIFLPKFGPGRVSEKGVTDVFDKLDLLGFDAKLAYVFETKVNRSYSKSDRPRRFDPLRGVSIQLSETMFVPKDITKARSIGKEPNAYMYCQQEVHRWMRNCISGGLAGRYIDIADQTQNQLAAIHGSQYLSSDTIDLSSASDSVHVDLVRRVFPRRLLFYMMGTRTSSTKVPYGPSPVRLHKFAPMGSAVCFPTQCILFTAISIYAYIAVHSERTTGDFIVTQQEVSEFIAHHLHRGRSEHTPFTKGKYEPPVVYGDDIICDSRVTDVIISTLNRLGFVVNRSKSFTGSMSFRESCGVYSYLGQDVTPVRFRLPFFEGEPDAKIFTSFIGGINQMRQHGYNHVASFWLSVMKSWGLRNPLPFKTDEDSFGMFTLNKHRPSERNLRWNADWQVHEERIQGIGPRRSTKIRRCTPVVERFLQQGKILTSREPAFLQAYSYDQWWRSNVRGGSLSPSGKGLRIRPQETGFKAVWSRLEM